MITLRLLPLILLLSGCGNSSSIQANELAAIHNIRAIHSAQVLFFAEHARFAAQLSELGPNGAGTIPGDLAGGAKQGYRFELHRDRVPDTASSTPAGGFQLIAVPLAIGTSGRRSFYVDQSRVIRASIGPAVVSGNSLPIE